MPPTSRSRPSSGARSTPPASTTGSARCSRAAAELLERPRLGDASFAALERLFSPREIVELILTVGYYMMVARLLESTAVDIDPPAGTAVVDSLR